MVWLFLIPCFNLIWQFFIATRIPDSLKNEFRDRDRDDGSDYGKTIALTQAVLGLLNVPLSMSSNLVAQQSPEISLAISGVSMILSLIGLVLFIVFWVKIANYSRMLGEEGDHRGRQRGGYDDDDDDDDYGRDRTPRGGTPKSVGIMAGDRD